MSETHISVRELRELPPYEIKEEIEELVSGLFRSALLMDNDDDELPLETSYFDLGLTSLSLVGLKQKLEALLDLSINANVLFNEPTVEQLVCYLTDLLAGASAESLPAQ
jgi:acyl carrier protein